MVRPTNGWAAVRPNWNGVLGMYWRVPPPQPPNVFYPSSWKGAVPGKTYPQFGLNPELRVVKQGTDPNA